MNRTLIKLDVLPRVEWLNGCTFSFVYVIVRLCLLAFCFLVLRLPSFSWVSSWIFFFFAFFFMVLFFFFHRVESGKHEHEGLGLLVLSAACSAWVHIYGSPWFLKFLTHVRNARNFSLVHNVGLRLRTNEKHAWNARNFSLVHNFSLKLRTN